MRVARPRPCASPFGPAFAGQNCSRQFGHNSPFLSSVLRGALVRAKAVPHVHAHTGLGGQEYENVRLSNVLAATEGAGRSSRLSRDADAGHLHRKQVVDFNTTVVSRATDANTTRQTAWERAALNPARRQVDSQHRRTRLFRQRATDAHEPTSCCLARPTRLSSRTATCRPSPQPGPTAAAQWPPRQAQVGGRAAASDTAGGV